MSLIQRAFCPPNKSYFIFGPRGTGKSTWAREYYPDATVIDLLHPAALRLYTAKPEHLKAVVAGSASPVIVIDEIQKVPHMLSLVHQLIEEDKRLQFILTGSSARKLKQSGVDLLAGRALLKHMHPFMASELGADFDMDSAMLYGLLPLVSASETPLEDLQTYVALYMQEEVQMEGFVRRLDAFSQFLESMSFSQGSVLNASNIARECHVSSKSIENYLTILEDLLLSFRLPIFSKKAKRQLTSKPKFYYFDVGVFRALRPQGPMHDTSALAGIALETLVAQHLRAWLDYGAAKGELYYWRTKAGLEVDFIVYGAIGFYAIEVKHATTLHARDFKGLLAFQEDYPQAQCIMLYRGISVLKYKEYNITVYPVDLFLKQLVPGRAIQGVALDTAFLI